MNTDSALEINPANPYNAIGSYLKSTFGEKIIKLSLDGGFTCPNRDGTLGVGGCIFCSEKGSGDFAGHPFLPITEQLASQIALLKKKWPQGSYIAYFQSFTNTYGDVGRMRTLFMEALSYSGVIGIAIATRPDCLSAEVLDLLNELNQITYLWVELGLQTIHPKTADLINRCYPLSTFDTAISDLAERRIRVVVHLILGLPGESRQDMIDSARYLSALPIFGIKLQMLHVLRGSRLLAEIPEPALKTISQEDYISLIVDILELLPREMTIHRLTGDAPRALLAAPLWSSNKTVVLNGIHKEFKRRGSYQGMRNGL